MHSRALLLMLAAHRNAARLHVNGGRRPSPPSVAHALVYRRQAHHARAMIRLRSLSTRAYHVALHVDVRAAPPDAASRAPVLFLHGMLGSATNFRSIALDLVRTRSTLSLDLREHGRSPHTPSASTLDDLAGDVVAAIDAHAPGVALDIVGHSLGGKVAMRVALTRPELVRRLVVVDIAPVQYAPSTNASWNGAQGVVRAAAAIDPRTYHTRADVDAALARDVPDAGMRSFVMQNLQPHTQGGYTWRCNLAAIQASLHHFAAFPSAEALVAPPPNDVHFIRGALSPYIRDEHTPTIHALFPHARIHTLEGAGHWVHADKPKEFVALLHDLLDC